MRIINGLIQDPVATLISILCSFLAMCVAISFHEYAHAFVANKLGDPTAKNMGRMTIDPTKHIDPIGAIFFVLFGIGWARPVIVNSRNLKHFRRDDIFISAAGPFMNLILSFLFYGLFFFGATMFGWDPYGIAMQIIFTIFQMNLWFAVFNILPIPPLDGFHVATSLFVKKQYRVVEFLQRYGFIILIILIFSGVLDYVLSAVSGWFISIFSAFYGLFL